MTDERPAPPARQRTGVDDARDKGREALERIGAIQPNQALKPWQEAVVVAIGDLQKLDVPQGQLDFVLVLAITKSLDDHTERMGRLAGTLNVVTGGLVFATLLLLMTPFIEGCVRSRHLTEEPRPSPTATTSPSAP